MPVWGVCPVVVLGCWMCGPLNLSTISTRIIVNLGVRNRRHKGAATRGVMGVKETPYGCVAPNCRWDPQRSRCLGSDAAWRQSVANTPAPRRSRLRDVDGAASGGKSPLSFHYQ